MFDVLGPLILVGFMFLYAWRAPVADAILGGYFIALIIHGILSHPERRQAIARGLRALASRCSPP